MSVNPCVKVTLSLAVVAVCGGLIGASVALHIQNRQMSRQRGIDLAMDAAEEWLAIRLNLTDEQRKKVGPVLERGKFEIRAIATNALDRAAEVRKQLDHDLRPMLTREQNERLDQLIELRGRVRERLQNPDAPAGGLRERIRERLQERRNEHAQPPGTP